MHDHHWFESEVAKTADDLRAFLAGLGAGQYLEEAVQDTYVALWHHGPLADDRTLPWLKGVAKHKLIDALRSRAAGSRRIELVEALSADEPDDEPEEDLRRSAALRQCLDLLPDRLRRLVDAFYFEDRTSEAIARALGISHVAVRKQMMRIRRILADCVRQRLVVPP